MRDHWKEAINEFGAGNLIKIFSDMPITEIDKLLSDGKMGPIILNAYKAGIEDGCTMVDKIYKEEISRLKGSLYIKKEENNKPTAKIDEEDITQLKKFLGIKEEEDNEPTA